MSPSFEFVGSAIATPLVVSSVLVAVGKRWLPGDRASRIAVPLAFAAAFAVGYLLLPAPWIPARHWHWLPWIAWSAALVGAVTTFESTRSISSVGILIALAVFAAWCLVPGWETLAPSRRVLLPSFALYLVALTLLLQRLPPVANRRSLVAIMVSAGLAVCLLTAAFVSNRYATLAMIASMALIGSGLTTRLTDQVLAVRALIPAYTHVLGGCALISAIEPTDPLFAFGVLPWIPWLVCVIPWCASSDDAANLRARALRWIVAIGIMVLTACWIHVSTLSPKPSPPLPEDEESLYFDEESFS